MHCVDQLKECQCCIDGKWVIARPLPQEPFVWRLQDAWAVLRRRADAVKFYKQ
jgi:hypothetical protein